MNRELQRMSRCFICRCRALPSGAGGGGGHVGSGRAERGEEGWGGGRGHGRPQRPQPGAEGEEQRERKGDGGQGWALRARTKPDRLKQQSWKILSSASSPLDLVHHPITGPLHRALPCFHFPLKWRKHCLPLSLRHPFVFFICFNYRVSFPFKKCRD